MISISDIILLFGLAVLGVGLYLEFSLGISLTVVGSLITIIGFKMVPRKVGN